MRVRAARPRTPTGEARHACDEVRPDIATISLLQDRALQEKQLLAEQLQGALNRRVVIEQAKGMLAERNRVTPDVAFSTLRAHARDTDQNLLAIAQQVIGDSLDTAALTRKGVL